MSGMMTHTIQVYRPTVTADAIGGQFKTYTLLKSIVGRMSGGTASGGSGRGSDNVQLQSAVAMLPVDTTILLSDVLFYNSEYYEIQTIINRGGHHIEAECVKVVPDVER